MWELEASDVAWRDRALVMMDVMAEVAPLLAERERIQAEARGC